MKTSTFAVAMFLSISVLARGGAIVSIESVSVAPGGAGAFDVWLTNTGPSPLTIGGFTFGVSVDSPDVSLTNANTATDNPYIFAAVSLFGPDLTGPNSGQTITVSDVYITPLLGSTVAAGASVGLGSVQFALSPNSGDGPYFTSFIPVRTSLADELGNAIAIEAMNGGSIIVVPEPSSWILIGAGAGLLWFRRRT